MIEKYYVSRFRIKYDRNDFNVLGADTSSCDSRAIRQTRYSQIISSVNPVRSVHLFSSAVTNVERETK